MQISHPQPCKEEILLFEEWVKTSAKISLGAVLKGDIESLAVICSKIIGNSRKMVTRGLDGWFSNMPNMRSSLLV